LDTHWLNRRELKGAKMSDEKNKSDLQWFDEYLIKVANNKSGIRRKIVVLKRFLNAITDKEKDTNMKLKRLKRTKR
jgi:hypothetical protein